MYGHKYTERFVSVMGLKIHSTLEDLPPFHRSHHSTPEELNAYVMSLSLLEGGYYDAGDNVKFGLPMAFTITMMSWSIVEYGRQMAASGELSNAMEAVKWGTDYLIKAHPHPFVLYGELQKAVNFVRNQLRQPEMSGKICLNSGYLPVLWTDVYKIIQHHIVDFGFGNVQLILSGAAPLATIVKLFYELVGQLSCSCKDMDPQKAVREHLSHYQMSWVDYILGDNPRATSYMVGYGNNYPQQVHHRASSIVSFKVLLLVDPTLIYDNFADQRDNYEQTKPATYNNAPLLGILARLHSGHSGYNQLLPVTFPAPKTQPKLAPVTGTTPSQVSSSAPIAIEQKMTSSWDYNGKTYYRYSTTVTNKSPKTLKFLNLSISKLYGPLWGLTKSGDSYVFPAWLNSLTAGKSLEFAYIHSASQANVSVSSYNLA
ncbi:hypothetical protein TEA_005087 [Camellia sinensis var. sinensis]|uniref:Endoglucanase n=1 Tax=Camellia sinensis var. sinensis TaxID=542762 RepID=A0A4S4DYL5_CAMSN|nr:hypothetical protein TEA_005087 [Camellia sinensis var. sinensis]